MLREVGFVIGGALLAAVGVVFFAVLLLLGAGWWAYSAYLASALMAGFGAFFIHVGRSEAAERRRELAEMEKETSPRPP